jgi:hypothetical protein
LIVIWIKGTYSGFMLPKSSVLTGFEHILGVYVTQILCSSWFRAHIRGLCYPNPLFFLVSGTYSGFMLPKSCVLLDFGHILGVYVTQILCSLGFRAHIQGLCYPNPLFSRVSGTYSEFMLPKSSVLLDFGHILGIKNAGA